MEEEEWKVIREFPKYSVSSLGNIRRNLNNRELSFYPNQYGVICVGLVKEHKQYNRSVALLVASAFIQKPFGPFDTPIHLNGVREHNMVANLDWRPRWFAVKYNRQFREPYENPINEPIIDIKTRFEYESSFDAATQFGLLEEDVVMSILNRTYVWPTYQEFEVLL